MKPSEFTTWATGRCSLRCKYCFVYKLYADQPQQDFYEDKIEPLISMAINQPKKPATIWWFGGEPTMAWDVIIKGINISKAKGLKLGQTGDLQFGLTTNLMGLNSKRAQILGQHKFGILCSIDGIESKHDKYRKTPTGTGSWKQCWENLKQVRKYINNNPQIRWSIVPDTLEGISEDIAFYVKEGMTNLACDPVYEVKWTEEDYRIYRNEMEKIRDYSIKWYRKGINLFLKPIRDGISPLTTRNRIWKSRCGLGQGGVGVDINGDIYPCHRFVSSKTCKMGNVETGIEDEARIKWIKEWQSRPPVSEDPNKCLTCIARSACTGGCLAVNYDVFGDVHACPTPVCELFKIQVETFLPMYKLMEAENNLAFMNSYKGGFNS